MVQFPACVPSSAEMPPHAWSFPCMRSSNIANLPYIHEVVYWIQEIQFFVISWEKTSSAEFGTTLICSGSGQRKREGLQ